METKGLFKLFAQFDFQRSHFRSSLSWVILPKMTFRSLFCPNLGDKKPEMPITFSNSASQSAFVMSQKTYRFLLNPSTCFLTFFSLTNRFSVCPSPGCPRRSPHKLSVLNFRASPFWKFLLFLATFPPFYLGKWGSKIFRVLLHSRLFAVFVLPESNRIIRAVLFPLPFAPNKVPTSFPGWSQCCA